MSTQVHVTNPPIPATTPAEVECNFRKLSGADRDWKTGELTPFVKYKERLLKRLWMNVNKTPGLGPWGNCWEWTGARDRDSGYGNMGVSVNQTEALGFKPGSGTQKTHVVAWIAAYGYTIPEGHEMCHKCNNKPCLREEHLFTGTHRTNIHHAMATGVMKSAKPKTETAHWRVMLSPHQVRTIRQTREQQGIALADLAYMAQLDKSHLSLMERGNRGCRLEQIIFILDFLGINKDDFGLNKCQTVPTSPPRKTTPKYKADPPQRVFRRPAFSALLNKKRPHWLSNAARTDIYDAQAIVDVLDSAEITQGAVIRATALSYNDVRSVVRGNPVSQKVLETMLRYVETLKQKAA